MLHRTDYPGLLSTFRALAVVLVMASSSSALAQDDSRGQMLALTQEGSAAFQEERFEDAALKFERAYEAYPDENLLKNAMVAWFKAGKCDRAIPSGERYIQVGKKVTPQDRSDVKTVLMECELKTAQGKLEFGKLDEAEDALDRAQASGPDEAFAPRIAALRQRIAAKREELAPDAAPVERSVAVRPAAGEDDSVDWIPVAGYASLGTGVVLLGAWVPYFISVKSQNDAFEEQIDSSSDGELDSCVRISADQLACSDPGDERRINENAERIDNYRTWGTVMWVGGAALAATGSGLLLYHYFLREPEAHAAGLTLQPELGPDRVGVRLHLRF